MNRKLKILISSYIDGECNHPDLVEDMLEQNKEAKKIYDELLLSKKIKDLEYHQCPVQFDKILIDRKREPLKQLLVTAGAVAISILFLLPLIKTSYQIQQFKNKIFTEVFR